MMAQVIMSDMDMRTPVDALVEQLACPPEPPGRRRSSNAFTLVELLVVISIISILISLVMPTLRQATEAAHLVGCRTQLRTLVEAGIRYGEDRNGRLPDSGAWWDATPHEHALNAYLGLRTGSYSEWPETFVDSVMTCPSATRFPGPMSHSRWACYNRTYHMNQHLSGSSRKNPVRNPDTGRAGWDTRHISMRAPLFFHRIPNPSGAGLFFDGFRATPAPIGRGRYYRGSASQSDFRFRDRFPSGNNGPSYFPHGPHRGSPDLRDEDQINVGFVDGHVRLVERRETEAHAEAWEESAFFGQ